VTIPGRCGPRRAEGRAGANKGGALKAGGPRAKRMRNPIHRGRTSIFLQNLEESRQALETLPAPIIAGFSPAEPWRTRLKGDGKNFRHHVGLLHQTVHPQRPAAGKDRGRTWKSTPWESSGGFSPSEADGIGCGFPQRRPGAGRFGTGFTEFAGWLPKSAWSRSRMNGFPYGDFHEPVVKHKGLHKPTWYEPAGWEYTWAKNGEISGSAFAAGAERSISTCT